MKYCDNCGSKLDEQQKFCPNCGKSLNANVNQVTNKNSSDFSIIRVFIGVIVGIGLIIGLAIYRANIDDIYGDSDDYDYSDSVDDYDYSHSVDDYIEKEPDYVVTSEEILDEYYKNGISAESKYKGKVVEITGKVTTIDKDYWDDDAYIGLSDGSYFSTTDVNCYLNKSYIEKSKNYKRGDKITVIGVVDEYYFNLDVKKCSIKD